MRSVRTACGSGWFTLRTTPSAKRGHPSFVRRELGKPPATGGGSDFGMRPHVKICCIANEQEAFDAISFGASAIGLVSEMPSGPGPLSDEEIVAIARSVPPPIATFLLTSQQTANGIISHHHRTRTNTIQIVDELTGRAYHEIRDALPNVKLVQVIHVTGEGSVDEAAGLGEHVDAILLDSGNPKLALKELGGTGRRHDWTLSRKIVETCGKPVFLAGGLNAENVGEALETVRPFGLDLCTGVRTDGRLDLRKLEAFFRAVD
jgi:phosphoribosylanthranilate isomerase